MPRDHGEWSLHEGGGLKRYRIAIRPGDRVRLRMPLAIRDHDGNPTGKVHPLGKIWTVLEGCAHEPEVIWLREPNGNPHTWPDDEFFDWFDVVPNA